MRKGRLLPAVLAVIALALPSAAAANIDIVGHARGFTVPTGGGNYIIVGTYVDSSGAPGTYYGSYHETTTGYASCRGTGIGVINCDNPPYYSGLPYRCNLISGSVTFRTIAGKQITFNIGAGGLAPPASRIVSGICQQLANPAVHDTYLLLWNRSDIWPATTEEFSRGFGLLDYALGSLTGTSAPRGNSPVYFDDLSLQLDLSPTV
jgi:hypothetical protein